MASSAMPNYPSNATTSKDEAAAPEETAKKKVEPVVTGTVRKRKKTLGRKVAETFTGDDAKSVGEYILFDVFIPAAKSMLADAASQGAERLLFGEVRRPRSTTAAQYRSGYTNYNSYSRNRTAAPADRRGFSAPGRPEPRDISRRARASHDFAEVLFETRVDAEAALDSMTELLSQYDVVTVMDFYDLVEITGNFTDEKYGWFDLRSASVEHIRDGYIINLPAPVNIDN